MIYQYKDFIPVIAADSFVHPLAAVTGQVFIGSGVYIGPGAAIRGDFGQIILEDGCNVQENTTLHSFPGERVLLRENAHVGHGAVIHGSTIGKNCLIGINAVILDHVILEEECIVGAMSFIRAGEKYSRRSLIVGNPAKKIGDVSDEMIQWKTEGTRVYQQLAADMQLHWKPCEPLRSGEPGDLGDKFYKPRISGGR